MNLNVEEEMSGGILIENFRDRADAILKRFSECECADITYYLPDGRVYEDCHKLIRDCLTRQPQDFVMVSIDCEDDYISLAFEPDGRLVVGWSNFSTTVEKAEAAISKLSKDIGGVASFLTLGPSIPSTYEEFRTWFQRSGVIRRWGSCSSE